MTNQELLRLMLRFQKALEEDRYDEVTRKAFADLLEENGMDDEALEHRQWTKERQQAIDVVEEFAAECEEDFDSLMEALDEQVKSRGSERYYLGTDTPWVAQDEEHLERLWGAYEYLRGEEVGDKVDKRASFFRCAC